MIDRPLTYNNRLLEYKAFLLLSNLSLESKYTGWKSMHFI